MSELQRDRQSDRPDVPGHRVDSVIGAGASAVVWSGRDAAGHPVAIKVPHRGLEAVAARHALVEQQVLMAVRHEHLVPLRSVVPLADGRLALVFDLVEGTSLQAMVRTRGHLRPGEVVTVLTPLCDAVASLHGAGGLHADVSPANITLTADGRPVLLDLGAARLAGHDDGEVHGTSGFIAPEVRLGSEPSEAADVYALGAVAWFCATGNGAPDTMGRLDVEIVASHVGSELAQVVAACIDPDPERRPGAAELARLFYEVAPAEPVEVVVGTDVASALTHRLRTTAGREAPSERSERSGRRRLWSGSAGRRWAVVVLAALLAVLVLAVAGLTMAPRLEGDAGVPTARSTARAPAVPATSAAARSPAAARVAVTAAAPSGATSARDGPAGVLLDALAPARRPAEVLQVLSDRRAAALTARDPDALAGVHAPDSASRAHDSEILATLVTSRNRWTGLRLEVAEAAYVSGGPTRAVLRARVGWTTYVVVAGDGTERAMPADAGRRLDFTLVRGPQGWRIQTISAAPTT